MMQATAFEYRHRFLIHGLIYTMCFAAPWSKLLPGIFYGPVWGFVQNHSVWFAMSNQFSKPLYQHFAVYWNAILVIMVLLAVAGATLRTWGASYLGATTVQRAGMVGDSVIAEGPFRFVRNPLYLGTTLHTIALAFLMRPEAAVLCIALITLIQFRLIFREEPYLLDRMGSAYAAYTAAVPRFLPSLSTHVKSSGDVRPNWKQGVLSELYVIGVAITLAGVGWSRGFGWETSVVRVMQGIIISLGVSVIARAFIPKATF
jgi:protein-S-isoprenylcysteine O-methyltransferase Ste14